MKCVPSNTGQSSRSVAPGMGCPSPSITAADPTPWGRTTGGSNRPQHLMANIRMVGAAGSSSKVETGPPQHSNSSLGVFPKEVSTYNHIPKLEITQTTTDR